MTPPNFGSQKMVRGPVAAGRRFGTKINGEEVGANGDGIQENFAVVPVLKVGSKIYRQGCTKIREI